MYALRLSTCSHHLGMRFHSLGPATSVWAASPCRAASSASMPGGFAAETSLLEGLPGLCQGPAMDRAWRVASPLLAGEGCRREDKLEAVSLLVAAATAASASSSSSWRPRYVEPRRFGRGADELRASLEHFEEAGFAVYRDVLDTPGAESLEEAQSLFWDFFESLGAGLGREASSHAWQDPRLRDLVGKGIFHACGVGQSAVQWHLRGQRRLREIFASLWGTDDLLVSMDGLVVFPSNYSFHGGNWYHWDLNPLLWQGDGLPMVQGYLSLQTGNSQSGGLVLVPASHQIFQALANRYKPSLRNLRDLHGHADHYVDFMGYDEATTASLDANAVTLHLQAGDFVVWDARTVHCNVGPRPGASQGPLVRAGALITMAPRSWASPEVLEARRLAYCRGVTLTHWPNHFVPTQQPEGGSRWQAITNSAINAINDKATRKKDDAALACRFQGPPTLDAPRLRLLGLDVDGEEPPSAGICGALPDYPLEIPAMSPIWSQS
ncbi:unnamed protein product [Polarella glacialis]|uniref:Uncharacterized protein n=1 Tax=Polarella glacialis TaxID=89957 RepID=A0A813FLZ4_POLGL|nr:unnamed protein product [Polarella glacialis]